MRKVPADSGTVFFAASDPPSASAASSGTNRPSSIAIAPKLAEKFVAP